MELYENLKALRNEHRYTQEALARKLYVTRQTVSKWELGLSEPSLDLLIAMADLYHVSVDELTGRAICAKCEPVAVEKSRNGWSVGKEAAAVLISGTVFSLVYGFLHLYFSVSITVAVAVEIPIYLLGTIATARADTHSREKEGIIGLILPLLLVFLWQAAMGILLEV